MSPAANDIDLVRQTTENSTLPADCITKWKALLKKAMTLMEPGNHSSKEEEPGKQAGSQFLIQQNYPKIQGAARPVRALERRKHLPRTPDSLTVVPGTHYRRREWTPPNCPLTHTYIPRTAAPIQTQAQKHLLHNNIKMNKT